MTGCASQGGDAVDYSVTLTTIHNTVTACQGRYPLPVPAITIPEDESSVGN